MTLELLQRLFSRAVLADEEAHLQEAEVGLGRRVGLALATPSAGCQSSSAASASGVCSEALKTQLLLSCACRVSGVRSLLKSAPFS